MNSTHAFIQWPHVEDLNNYRPGGFHPVLLNDIFKDGRYTVVHKLGYGTYSTVWLVKDSMTGKYASLKILVSDASKWSGNSGDYETKVLSHICAQHEEDEGKDYVLQLLDHFDHEGPNGVHRCIVTEVLGPSLNVNLADLYPTRTFPTDVIRRFVYQLSLGIKFLHKRNIVHGGTSPLKNAIFPDLRGMPQISI
jgi:serine/threonine-protein kinase SRPK3